MIKSFETDPQMIPRSSQNVPEIIPKWSINDSVVIVVIITIVIVIIVPVIVMVEAGLGPSSALITSRLAWRMLNLPWQRWVGPTTLW